MANVVIKVRFNDETRRFSLPRTATWEDLRQNLISLLKLPAVNFTVSYTDEEGDQVNLSTDGELAELLNFNEIVHLSVRTQQPVTHNESQEHDANEHHNETTTDATASSSSSSEPVTTTDASASSDHSDSHATHEHQTSASEPSSNNTVATESKPANSEPVANKRTSTSVLEDLQKLYVTFTERNKDLFELAEQLNEELDIALMKEAEERRRQFWEAQRKAQEERARLIEERRRQYLEAYKQRQAAQQQQQQQKQQQRKEQTTQDSRQLNQQAYDQERRERRHQQRLLDLSELQSNLATHYFIPRTNPWFTLFV